ncbi:hypothetical protein GIB67_025510 [Kingdonia uniflora]|uniref:Receptor ligand binding region domain-containing protein n=1 Tax=Kingdonia uniflora TaxID=39325 RepID=A0A7J7PD42_9MAGN|nr:hypothetical protein GIB67_025510 [Kingdonia uniflora]
MDSITSMFNAVNSSVMSTMEGVIGIKTHYSETNPSFKDFSIKFHKGFRSEYPDEEMSEPGFYALCAYDTISTIAKAVVGLANNFTSEKLLRNILMSSFNGLSGKVQFIDGQISSLPVYQIANVVRKGYIEPKFWTPKFAFSDSKERSGGSGGTLRVLGGYVNRPGGLLNQTPCGWVMPTDAKPMTIGVPGRISFEKFVKVKPGVTGFCIDVFK